MLVSIQSWFEKNYAPEQRVVIDLYFGGALGQGGISRIEFWPSMWNKER
jgi:hypothetical protein